MDRNKKPLVGKPTGRKSTADKETYITPEGEEVSEKSVSFPIRLENKVVWVNAPSIYNGVQHSEEEVRDKINAGEVKATSVHESREEAEEAAKKRSEGLLKNYAVGGIVNADDPEAQLVENADKTPVSPTQFAKGAGKAAFQTAKGVATGAVGITGDLISISQGVKEILSRTNDEEAAAAFVRGMEQKTGLPTTEDVNTFIDQWLPTSLKSGSMAQDIGEMASPGGAVKAIAKGAKKAAPMLAKEAATQTEKLMRKQGLMPSIVPEGKTLTRSPYDAVGLTDEGVEEWRTLNRVKNRQEPIDEVKAAAQKLRDGEISSADYRQIVKEYQPIIPLKEVPKVPTLKELVAALNKDKVETGVVGINKTFKDGEKVASRLDIPAYDNYDTWVVSLHDGTKTGGKSLGYAQTAVLKNVDFRTAPSGALKIATKDKAKETIARIHGDWVNESSESVAKRAEEAINSTEWTQIGMNPFRHSYFYDKADGMPVVEAEEIIQVGPLVLAKKPKYASPDDPQFRIRKNDETSPTFAVGGVVEEKQKKYAKGGNVEQMNKLFADGGMMDDSGESVNGVEVPPGSLREEVADDIPAQLSEGEFVVPADVVRYIGLEKLMAMRDKAKQGLQRMNEMGQMGNAEEVANPDQTFSEQGDEDFEAEIDDIMAEEGDDAIPEGFARGGIVKDASSMRWAQAPGVDVRYFKHPDGRLMFITYINGKPSTSIPDGFVETKEPVEKLVGKVAEEKEEVKQEKIINETGAGSGGDTGGGPTPSPTPKGFQTTAKSTAALKAMEATPITAVMPGMTAVYGITKGINAAINAQNAALLASRAETAGVNAGWTPAAVDAGSKAAAQEAGREGATKGSIAAAAADAMAATDGRNPMDAMMATIDAAGGVPDVQGPDTGAGYSGGTASGGGQPGTDFGDPGRGNMYAKGGMVKKRPAKAKPTKKGLAAKK